MVMLDSILQENTWKSYTPPQLLKQIRSDAERGDFFSVYDSLEQNLEYFKGKDRKELTIIGEKGIENSLMYARIDAERGIISRMNEYLELASKYSNLFNLEISEQVKEIQTLGNDNKIIYKDVKSKPKKKGITRIAGYCDL
ncbi:MAG: hypothetical protein WC393_03530 [Candidatus Nanoarchaeia archaeon]|jgi:hypothetical protein